MKTSVTVEACTLNADETDWTEAEIWINRDDGDEEMRCQSLIVNKAEFEAIWQAMSLQKDQGIWSLRTVES